MTTLQFADTHNLVAFLSKPVESKGFKQIMDFLNVNLIRYALTINPTIYTLCIEQFWAIVKVKTVNEEVQLQALEDSKKVIITESTLRRDLHLEDAEGVDCLPNATIFEQLTLMGAKTTAWNEFSSTIASAIICLAINQKFNFSFKVHIKYGEELRNISRRSKRKDTEVPQPSGPTTNVADEAVNEEMDDSLVRAATTASSLEAEQDSGNIFKTQSKATPNEPSSLGTSSGGGPRRQETMGDTIAQTRSENVSKLSNDPLLARGLGEEDASKEGMIVDIDANAGINLVSTYFDADTDMFKVHDLVGDEVVVESEVAVKAASTIPVSAATTTTTVITDDEITLAKALAELKSAKLPTTTAATTITTASTRPKAKGLVIHEQEQAPTLIVSLQQPSQLNVQDKVKRAEEKRNKPPTRAQQRSLMCTYLKSMKGWKPKDLKNKSFVNIQELFDKAMKRVNTFVDYRTELVEESSKKAEAEIAKESSSKRAGTKLEQESIKKKKVDEDKETTELQRLIEIIPDKEEVAIDSIPLATKPSSIVDYKIHKEGKKTYYQIIMVDISSKMYLIFSYMLKSFDIEDVETLWKLVKAKHGSTRPKEGYKRVL
ncbi:hypothetical protein Tco_0596165 [Tanacetum coccineum]